MSMLPSDNTGGNRCRNLRPPIFSATCAHCSVGIGSAIECYILCLYLRFVLFRMSILKAMLGAKLDGLYTCEYINSFMGSRSLSQVLPAQSFGKDI